LTSERNLVEDLPPAACWRPGISRAVGAERISGPRREQTRVLFFNEGNLGTHVLGHMRHAAAMRTGAAAVGHVEIRLAELAPMSRLQIALTSRRIPHLAQRNLDLTALRWHVVQSQRARRAIERELRAWPADVVHIHSHAVALALGGTMRRVPVALSVDTTVADWWGMPAWRPPQSYAPLAILPSRALERRALTRAAVVLACTRWAQRAVERAAPKAHVVEHHPGIDLERFVPASRREREGGRARVLFVGGRFVEKGGEDLLAALAPELGKGVELDIVTPADVPAREGVRLHRLGPSDPRLLDLQQQADVMCLPTHGDSNPWAVLEAMACGTPVVSSEVGGIADMLRHDQAGAIVPCGDRRALRETLLALLADPQRRERLGARGRELCEERFDARLQFRRLADHLEAAIARHSGAVA
jgi:glycosyltransferase involved in cell wall biosynthesis